MIRALLDQGLSPVAAVHLRDHGWDAIHVMEVGLNRAEDIEILTYAAREGRACVTLDHDFHAHLAIAQLGGPSVVLIRLEGLTSKEQAALLLKVWKSSFDEIEAGAAVSVDASSIRIRRLPLR